jgi:regulator of protease activity HflC (stomatin/prohibitin superfamily)
MPTPDTLYLIKILITLFGFFVFFVIIFIVGALKIVPEDQRLVVFRMGKCIGTRGPGIVLLIPFVDRVVVVKHLSAFEYKYTNLPALDGQRIACMVTLLGRVTDPEKSILNVPNLELALSEVIARELTALTAEKNSPVLFTSAAWMEDSLKSAVSLASRSWGYEPSAVKVTEIRYS